MAGAAGVASVGVARPGTAAPPPAPPSTTPLPLLIHGADWRVVRPGVAPGTLPPAGSAALPMGRLVDTDGTELGRFDSSSMPTSGAGTQLHRLLFADGTITAVGPATTGDAEYAVVGGTGRYAHASGSYHLQQRPAPSGGTATFTLDITIPEA